MLPSFALSVDWKKFSVRSLPLHRMITADLTGIGDRSVHEINDV